MLAWVRARTHVPQPSLFLTVCVHSLCFSLTLRSPYEERAALSELHGRQLPAFSHAMSSLSYLNKSLSHSTNTLRLKFEQSWL